MIKMAKFHKVSFEQFKQDMVSFGLAESALQDIYDGISLPRRATGGSAGYDFFAPWAISLKQGESILIPTGIRVEIENGWFLAIFPRSGLGIKYRLQLDNTVGIIDSDYFMAKNEGHIMIKVTNDFKSEKTLQLEKGQGFAQGIFLSYGICVDDEAEGERMGGFGSTDEKK